MKLLYRIILQTGTAYGGTTKSRVRQVDDFRDVTNVQSSIITPSANFISSVGTGFTVTAGQLNLNASLWSIDVNGQLSLPTTGTTGGLLIGTDTTIYRGTTAEIWFGSNGFYLIGTINGLVPFRIQNSQTAAANVGSRIIFTGDAGFTNMGYITSAWEGAATTNSYMAWSTRLSGTIAEKMRLDSSGHLTTVGAVIIDGSISGYTNELKFGSTGAGLELGISTVSTGSPVMHFDHRATSNTGTWNWRNGTVAANVQMTLDGSGNLYIAGISVTGGTSKHFSLVGEGTLNTDACWIGDSSKNLYLQMGSGGNIYFRDATANAKMTLTSAGLLQPVTVQPTTAYKSVDGTSGESATITIGANTITVKNGLVVAHT